jgi:hypothetical protein
MKALANDRCVSVVGDPDQSSVTSFIKVIISSTDDGRVKTQFTAGALQKSKIWKRCVVVGLRNLNLYIHGVQLLPQRSQALKRYSWSKTIAPQQPFSKLA